MMRHQCVGLTPTKKLHDVRRRIHHGIAKWLPQLASSIAWIALFSSFRTFSANIVIFCQWSFLDSIFYTTLTSSRESTASCTAALSWPPPEKNVVNVVFCKEVIFTLCTLHYSQSCQVWVEIPMSTKKLLFIYYSMFGISKAILTNVSQ